jgi:glycosyltransferase involved in cell wall biosynthesis
VRIVWVVYGSLEQRTGGYLYDRQVIGGLRRRGHAVSVESLSSSGFGAAVRLALHLRRGGCDVVVGDELCHRELAFAFAALGAPRGSKASWGAGGSCRSAPRRVLLVHHLAEWEDDRPRWSEWLSLRLSDAVVTTSRTSAARLHQSFGIRAETCVPGADRMPAFPEGDDRPNAHPPRDGRVELLFVGTWTPRKQLLLLFDALRRLGPLDYRLTVVGDPSRDPEHARRVRETLSTTPDVASRTVLLGEVDDARLNALYATSDVLVSPSNFEGYGMAIAEALHAGLAVVATHGGAVPEVVRAGEDALLIPPHDVDALAAALAVVIRDREARAGLRQCAARRRLPRWNETVEQFERVLTGLVAGGS